MASIIEFLEARIAEQEQAAKGAATMMGGGAWGNDGTCVTSGEDAFWVDGLHVQSPELVSEHIVRHNPARVLAECAAKRAIIKQHEDWPVLVEREPILEQIDSMQTMTVRMTQELMWQTERQYVKRFGTEPPTAPMIRTLAAVYSDHPEYQQEWAA